MSFRTAENENLLHTWNYSSLENGELTIGSTITLTDKRLIISNKSDIHSSTKEIQLKNITRFEGQVAKSSTLPALIMLIVAGVFLLVGGIGLLVKVSALIIALVIGVILGISGITTYNKLKAAKSFTISLFTEQDDSVYAINVGFILLSQLLTTSVTAVAVNFEVCYQILEELGAAIINAKEK